MRISVVLLLLLCSSAFAAPMIESDVVVLEAARLKADITGDAVAAEKIQQSINKRRQWLHEHNDKKFVLVNVAAQELQLFDANKLILQERVIVGRPGMETPSFTNAIKSIVFNPVWNVPPDLAVDMLRQMKEVGGWPGYTIYVDGTATPLDRVSTDSNYRIVQDPSETNALGKIKFNLPNKYGVYIHDTPWKHLFEESNRQFSAGCVRLDNADKLAAYILRVHRDDVMAVANTGVSREITLNAPIKVFIVNWEVWVDRDGNIQL